MKSDEGHKKTIPLTINIPEMEITMKKEIWLEKLRVLATIAVVLIHVVQGSFVNGTAGVSVYRCMFDTSFLMGSTSWAVPVFVMISGYLLLDPEKELPVAKIKKYILRMLGVLVTVGLGFCVMESVVNYHENGVFFVLKDAVVNLICGRSWAHMWYVYMLVGLYMLTPVLRAFVKESSEETAKFVLFSLFVLTIAFPTVSRVLGVNVTNFYLSAFPYLFYYLFGHYVKKLTFSVTYGYVSGILAFLVCVCISSLQIEPRHPVYYYDSVFLALLSMSIFFVAYKNRDRQGKKEENEKTIRLINYIAERSFWIYLSHPVVFNLLNKGFEIYVTQFPVVLGELLFFAVALFFSLLTYEIMVRLPIIGRWL